MTSGTFTAVAQPVEDLRAPPETVKGAGGNTEAKLKTGGASGRRVPCDQVISQVDRQGYANGRRGADISDVATNLGTSAVWVERCMLAYGRQVRRPSTKSADSKAQLLESLERNEPEERGPEEIEEPGARPRESAEKQLRKPIRPTPEVEKNRSD